jgi:hypothetical protein
MPMGLGMVCDIIILVAAVLVAITNIYKFFANSGKGIKKKVDEVTAEKEAEFNTKVDERAKLVAQPMIDSAVRTLTASFEGLLDKHLPERLLAHDHETRRKYLEDRQRYLEEIKDEVVCVLQDRIDAVDEHDDQMKVFSEVMKELLRERIMEIYRRNRTERQLEDHERYELRQAYASYKSIGGNSYIDGYYETMDGWITVPDEH